MNVLKLLAYVFGAVGAVLVAGCVFAIVQVVSFQRHALHATGTVVAIQQSQSHSRSRQDPIGGRYITMYAPVVEFETPAGRQRFTSRVRTSPSKYDVGENVGVLYPPEEPARAEVDAFVDRWFMVLVLAPMALGFGGVGAGFGIYFWRRRRRQRWLAQFGVRVKAAYLGAERDMSISSGDKHPWRLVCEWRDPATNQAHRMQSDPMWEDPRPRVRGQTVDAIIDPANPRRYQLVVDFLAPSP